MARSNDIRKWIWMGPLTLLCCFFAACGFCAPSSPPSPAYTPLGSGQCSIRANQPPDNPCVVCDTATRDWLPIADGSSCGAAGICFQGSCTAGCLIDSAYYQQGEVKNDNECLVCDGSDTTGWSYVPDGTACANGGGYCRQGQCAAACEVGGQLYATGATDPKNDCQACNPSYASTRFIAVPDGTSCAQGGTFCRSGACANVCNVGGTFVADKTMEPGQDACCAAGVDPTGWTPSFRSVANPNGLSGSGNVLAADIDGDGIADLVSDSEIQFGKGDGTFQPPSKLPATGSGAGDADVVAADFNGDGRFDLALLSEGHGQNSQVTVLLNQGNRTFSVAQRIAIGEEAHSLIAADLQRPGSHDLALLDMGPVTGLTGPEVTVLLDQNGTLAPGPEIPAPGAVALAAAAFSKPGTIDLAYAQMSQAGLGIVGLLNQGAGASFATTASSTVGAAPSSDPAFLQAADIDGDGLPDLVLSTASPGVSVWINGSAFSAGFLPHPPFDGIPGGGPIALGDFNGDGTADLAVSAPGAGTVAVLYNQTTPGSPPSFSPPSSFQANLGSSLAVADLDGDGSLDLAGAPAELLRSCR
ncbi:MAG: FG-GAP repeat domain-containing protein [Myxococcales bacterium]